MPCKQSIKGIGSKKNPCWLFQQGFEYDIILLHEWTDLLEKSGKFIITTARNNIDIEVLLKNMNF